MTPNSEPFIPWDTLEVSDSELESSPSPLAPFTETDEAPSETKVPLATLSDDLLREILSLKVGALPPTHDPDAVTVFRQLKTLQLEAAKVVTRKEEIKDESTARSSRLAEVWLLYQQSHARLEALRHPVLDAEKF